MTGTATVGDERLPPPTRGAAATQAAAEVLDIVTPAGSESVTEGTILEWAVKVGDAVRDGDTVVEISTDKVDMELPAPADGTITEILYEEGETVGVGEVIARMSVGASAARRLLPLSRRRRETAARGAPAPAAGVRQGCDPDRPARRRGSWRELANVAGSARGGRVTKDDVLAVARTWSRFLRVPRRSRVVARTSALYGGEPSIPTATSFRTLTVSLSTPVASS